MVSEIEKSLKELLDICQQAPIQGILPATLRAEKALADESANVARLKADLRIVLPRTALHASTKEGGAAAWSRLSEWSHSD